MATAKKIKKMRRTAVPKPLRRLVFTGLMLVIAASIFAVMQNLPQPTGRGLYTGYPTKLRADYASLQDAVAKLLDQQTRDDASLVSTASVQEQLSQIQLTAAAGNYVSAETQIKQLSSQVRGWQKQLQVGLVAAATTPLPTPAPGNTAYSQAGNGDLFIPILIYHYPPADLAAQLDYLETHHYTVVGLDSVVAGLHNPASLPAKPVVLTFDDGFANQMSAFQLLKAHNMKATFYIINGGEASHWCIGAGRRYGDPSQPPSGCGDAYLTWDQVRELDASGLITIGGHTLDHPQLTTLSTDEQRHEIVDSKAGIEAEIGHPIYDFAYPYGNYNATTVSLVAAAGYRSAVTTLPGDYQAPGSQYTLERIRTTIGLP